MIDLYKAYSMEPAVDLLAKNFRQVLVISSFYNHTRIRLRADLLKEKRIWFQGTERQIELWRQRGGVYLSWIWDLHEGPHDAIFISECPRQIEFLDRMCRKTRVIGCVYQPPTWRIHEETIIRRYRDRPLEIQLRSVDRLERIKQLMDRLPVLTPYRVARSLAARAQSQSSDVPAPPEAAAPPSDTTPASP